MATSVCGDPACVTSMPSATTTAAQRDAGGSKWGEASGWARARLKPFPVSRGYKWQRQSRNQDSRVRTDLRCCLVNHKVPRNETGRKPAQCSLDL